MELLTRKLLDILEEFAFMIFAMSHWKPGCNWVGNGTDGAFFQKSTVVDHAWKHFGGDCLLEVFCCIVLLKMELN